MSAVPQVNEAPFGCAFFAHPGPSRFRIAVPGELSLVRAHIDVGLDMTQFVHNTTFQSKAGRPTETLVNVDRVTVRLYRVVQQGIWRTPRYRNGSVQQFWE